MTNREIITRALRHMGVLQAGQEVDGTDLADAMVTLQEVIDSLPFLRTGPWTDKFLDSNATYAAAEGERIHPGAFTATITLPLTYTDEWGQTLATRDLSRVQIMGPDHAQAGLWVYVADVGAWKRVDALTIVGDSPFGPNDNAGLAAILAVSLAAEYGAAAQLGDMIAGRAQRAMTSFRGRFYRPFVTPVEDAFLLTSDLGNGEWFDGIIR